jgi:hypothetical protein
MYLDAPLLGLPLHVNLDSQLALEGYHLLVHAADLLYDGMLSEVVGQVGQKLANLEKIMLFYYIEIII